MLAFFYTDLKKSYVDILGNAGQTVSQPKELAPQMDMQFFNPVQQQPQVSFQNKPTKFSRLKLSDFSGNAVL